MSEEKLSKKLKKLEDAINKEFKEANLDIIIKVLGINTTGTSAGALIHSIYFPDIMSENNHIKYRMII